MSSIPSVRLHASSGVSILNAPMLELRGHLMGEVRAVLALLRSALKRPCG